MEIHVATIYVVKNKVKKKTVLYCNILKYFVLHIWFIFHILHIYVIKWNRCILFFFIVYATGYFKRLRQIQVKIWVEYQKTVDLLYISL